MTIKQLIQYLNQMDNPDMVVKIGYDTEEGFHCGDVETVKIIYNKGKDVVFIS